MANAETGDADLRRAIAQRLRFERAMGVETVRPEKPIRTPSLSAPAAPPPAAARPSNVDPETLWRELEERTKKCTACFLRQGARNVVFGRGSHKAEVCFVGEAPGADEDAQGLPFVGRAGQLLDRIIAAMGLPAEQVYICNVAKCRPPENRTPTPEEMAACLPLLEEQIALLRPKVLVTLGGTATKALLRIDRGIMSVRGTWFTYQGIPVMPTYHPSFLLHAYTEQNRRAVWEDMKKVMQKLAELRSVS